MLMKRLGSVCLLIILLLLTMVSSTRLAAQDDEPRSPYRVDVLAVNDSRYPTLDIYLSVVNPLTGEAVTDLLPTDFTLLADGEALAISTFDTDSTANRPLQLIIVLDLTSSVSLTEFENMRTAAISLIRTLNVADEVGIMAMDHTSTRTLQPLFIDHNAAINAMFGEDVGPVPGEVGNVVADGLLRAVEAFTETTPNVRPVVVLFTDVTNGSVGGESTLETVQALAQQRGAAIYTAYFETESDNGLPISAIAPQELVALANATGGLLLQSTGERNPQLVGDYNDDASLPQLAERIAAILEAEYRLTVLSPLPSDNTIKDLNISVNIEGTTTQPISTFFRARNDILEIAFDGLQNGQRVQLPIDVRVRVLASSRPVVRLQLYRIDNDSGDEILLADLAPANPVFSLTSEAIGAGTLSLRAVAYDDTGEQNDTFLTLLVGNPNATPTFTPTSTLTLPPALTATPTVTDTLPAINTTTPTPSVTPTLADANDENRNSPNAPFIPLVLALVGIGGMLLASFGFWRFIRRPDRTPTERPTVPRRPSPNDPTASIPLSSLQQTMRLESTPDKGIWQKALENADTTAMPATESELAARAILIGKKNEHYILYEGENTIGRHGTNIVQILDATVSRYHAVLEIYGDDFFIQDWQASYPTSVNGKPLEKGERRALSHGDQIQFGATPLRLVLRK